MYTKYITRFAGLSACAGMLFAGGEAAAITVTIDGESSPTLLSDAVDTCMTAGVGPHVINITVDALSEADRQIVINNPITINGDADNNGTPCDILVDTDGIVDAIDVGAPDYKSYLEIQTAGEVNISDVNIHPQADGKFPGFGNRYIRSVSGIRFLKPVLESDVGTYNLTNVGVSGSAPDEASTYLSLGTDEDLFNLSGRKRWGGLGNATANEVNHVLHAAIHYGDLLGSGSIVSKLDHVEAGLSRGCALSINTNNCTVEILGGIYGHSARDGIRIAEGANVTVKGTAEDRVRVVRAANIGGKNAHSIEVAGGATVPLIEYADVAGENTANGLSVQGSVVTEVNNVRVLGKFQETDPNNHGIILSGDVNVGLISNSTVHGQGEPIGDPLGINAGVINPVIIQDTIFTSHYTTETIFVGSTTPAVATFNYCALPTDGVVGESMADPAISGPDFGLPYPDVVVVNNSINTSPQYLLTLENYDWSDTQGADDLLNGAGNRNVLRPSNVAYLTAGTGGTSLVGGAGPLLSGIDAGTWMLME